MLSESSSLMCRIARPDPEADPEAISLCCAAAIGLTFLPACEIRASNDSLQIGCASGKCLAALRTLFARRVTCEIQLALLVMVRVDEALIFSGMEQLRQMAASMRTHRASPWQVA